MTDVVVKVIDISPDPETVNIIMNTPTGIGPAGPAGAGTDTGDITFSGTSINGEGIVSLNSTAAPGWINLTAYEGAYVNGISADNKIATIGDLEAITLTPGPQGEPGPQGAPGAPGAGVAIGGTVGQILSKLSGVDYDTQWIDNYTSEVKHIVKATESISKGQAVYVSSADGTNMLVSKASNNGEFSSSKTMGLLQQSLGVNDQGYVVTEGLLSGLNTSTAQAGDPVWLGTNGNLLYGLLNKPVAPNHLVFIGVVTRVQQNNGEIFVRPQNGFELNEIHDALIVNPQPGDVLTFNGVLWVNQQP